MKENELRSHAVCNLCGQKIGAAGLPIFWTVKIERFGIDLGAVRRQDGLASLIGNSFVANVMGADEEMTIPLMEAITLTVCEKCATIESHNIAHLSERR